MVPVTPYHQHSQHLGVQICEMKPTLKWLILHTDGSLESECHVKIDVKYRGETVLKTKYSTFFLLCFQCALLLTVVGLVCVLLLTCEFCCYAMCIVVLCVYYYLRYFSCLIAG